MRIVGGSLRGRRLLAPAGNVARPTAERVREAMASLLTSRCRIAGTEVLDLFAGSGALAFEMLSRGAAKAVAVEVHREALRCLRHNAQALQLVDRLDVLVVDLLRQPLAAAALLQARHPAPFDLVFVDPPYAAIETVPPLLQALLEHRLLQPHAYLVVEHAVRQPPASWGDFSLLARYRHGDTALQLLAPPPANP